MKSILYYRSKKILLSLFIHLFLMSVAFSCLYPVLWMVSSSLKTQETIFRDVSLIPKEPNFKNYLLAMKESNFGRYFLNSIFYTVSVVFVLVIISSLAGYAFSRLNFPGKNFLFILFISAMMIPLPGSFVALFVLLNKLHLRDTVLGYILSLVCSGLSLSIFLFKTFFDRMPQELEDMARIDGCSKLRTFWHVALPFSKPILAVVITFNALAVWNEYLLALIIFDNKNLMPLQRALIVFQGEFLTNYPLLMAGLTISALPVILFYIIVHKYVVKGVASAVLFS